jgi:predicted nuclease of restriction endonuclease-like (RecB) superfamily
MWQAGAAAMSVSIDRIELMTDARDLALPSGYTDLLGELKDRVRAARTQAIRTVNTQLIELYWSIGKTILERQEIEEWGSRVMSRLADDLRAEFPEMKGLSRSNLFYMRGFAAAWPESIVQQAVGQLPWGHITVLLDKLDSPEDRSWYASAAVQYGWSRNVLMNMIMNKTLQRTGAAPSNFVQRLVGPDSELAQQVAKDPYNFEFLGLSGEVAERDLENALTSRITETLRELGPGFSFVGRQVHFDVDGDDFYVDLLFFHIEQLRYVVVELKTGKFQPEYAGKLNFYVALVDDLLRREHHNETIGILICGTKNDRSVRYSLGRSTSPMAVASYTYDKLPPAEQKALPNEGHLVAALEWAEPDSEVIDGGLQEGLAD